jgi:crossover junction endodeoxyribonuclease RuvC
MIILGIDPGTSIIGYGIIKKEKEVSPLGYGCINTAHHLSRAGKLNDLYTQLTILIKKFKPNAVAVEDIFFFKNLKTAIRVSEARGVILLAAAQQKIPIYEYTPLQVKQAITTYGRAEKIQVQKMVKILLELEEIPRPDDAADALAIAICCAHSVNKDY